MKDDLYRKKSLDKVKSPERLNEYVKVASPALWLLLIATVLLVVGALVWASTYKLVMNASTNASVTSNNVTLTFSDVDFKNVKEGDPVHIAGKEGTVESIDKDNKVAYTTLDLTNGDYEGYVIVEVLPISFIVN